MKSMRMLRAQSTGTSADDKLPADACVFDFQLAFGTGLEGSTLEGALGYTVADDGTVTGLLSVYPKKHPVTGTATGLAVSLLVTLPDDQYITLAGVAVSDLSNCPEVIEGTGGGPANGTLSTWKAMKTTDPETVSDLVEGTP